MPPMPEGEGKRREEGTVNGRHHQKHLQVNQTSGTGASSPAPHPTAPHSSPAPAKPSRDRCPAGSSGQGRGREADEPRCWRDEVTLKLLGKNPKMICGFEGRETDERAAAGAGGGTGTWWGRSGQRQGARGDGCPARRPSGSAAAAPLGLTAGPEPQRSGSGDGGGGLTILPRGPVPSNRHRPRCGSAGGSSLTFPAGGASARCPGPGGGGDDVGRGGREGGRLDPQRQQEKEGEGGGAAGAGAAAARAALRYPRWVPVNAPFSLLLSISPGGWVHGTRATEPSGQQRPPPAPAHWRL